MQHPSKIRSLLAGACLPGLALLSAPTTLFATGLCDGLTQVECRSIGSRTTYALLGNNVIAQVYGSKVLGLKRISDIEGNLIGIDFRASGQANAARNNTVGLYGLTDTGKIYFLSAGVGGGPSTLVSSLTGGTTFDGGYQALVDFNPVVDALRVIGSNDQNFAVVNSNGNLNATAVQTAITYAAGDPNAGRDPNLTAGAYNNNVPAAANTIFYALDYARDTLVTIADVTNGSSATGGGRLKTIGKIVDAAGEPINIVPEAGMDIFTDQSIGNGALISNGQTLYFINLATVNANQPVGTTQTVVAKELGADVTPFVRLIQVAPGAFMDVAVSPTVLLPNPADLRLSETINTAGFTNGQARTYEIKVTNNGSDNQANTMFFAQSLPFKDPVVRPSQGSCTLNALNQFGRTFQCDLGTLAFGNTATVRITVSRVSDANANDANLVSSFFTRGPQGGLVLLPEDPDITNNSLTSNVTNNR